MFDMKFLNVIQVFRRKKQFDPLKKPFKACDLKGYKTCSEDGS